ncbi:MAG TPA: hypothetical protein VLX91_08660 [Candidatus Acidoferrales bacterium]|nr:hypothetical protein [Candidatus Acidoferrales bacterium]
MKQLRMQIGHDVTIRRKHPNQVTPFFATEFQLHEAVQVSASVHNLTSRSCFIEIDFDLYLSFLVWPGISQRECPDVGVRFTIAGCAFVALISSTLKLIVP